MPVLIIRKAIHILAAGLGAIFLIIGAVTGFSPDAITVDLAAFIRFMGPVLIGLICSAGVLEILLEGRTQGPPRVK